MATYTISVNERTVSGKALLDYLRKLGVVMGRMSPERKGSYRLSKEDVREGRVETFTSSDDMFKSLGI